MNLFFDILIALFLTCPLPNEVSDTLTIEIKKSESVENETDYYKILIFEQNSCKEKGYIQFSFNNATKQAYIEYLHIYKNERRKNYGSILLTFALETLTELQAVKVEWHASPFDLAMGEERDTMLPKLIAFYERHGARMTQFTQTGNAQMVYKPNN